MTITLKKEANPNSIVLRHNILLETIGLISGREEALQTEKDLYLILSMMNNICEEDLITECNEDDRNLNRIMEEEVEPQFLKLIENDEWKRVFEDCKFELLRYTERLYQNEHSIMGIIDSILMMIQNMDEADKKEALVATGKLAEAAYNKRTEQLEAKTEETNDKLRELINQFSKKVEIVQDKVTTEEK